MATRNTLFSLLLVVGVFAGCKPRDYNANVASGNLTSTHNSLSLTKAETSKIAEKHATCPFVGSAVAEGKLPVQKSVDNPLALKEDLKNLGNSGGGDLGVVLLAFAEGNHTLMLGKSGKMDTPAPAGMFSLVFPGSQGSHAGDTGILKPQGRGEPGVGRTDALRFDQLFPKKPDSDTITLSDIGRVIARDVYQDKNSLVFGRNAAVALREDLRGLINESSEIVVKKIFGKTVPDDYREFFQVLTKTAGENNLVGSAGEFGLLASFLYNSPRTIRKVPLDPEFSREEIRMMFIDKKFPEGWQNWPKYSHDWVKFSVRLAVEAAKSYVTLNKQ
ncbi:hypothetical protein EBR21_10155 [bacterium]|nr:hypothetical protein [bacterium]